MIISCSSLTKTFDGKDVLKDITFMMDDHDKMAIIGVNGAGKSTLLRIIQNNESYDSGTLSIPNDVKIGYLSGLKHFIDIKIQFIALYRLFFCQTFCFLMW